MGHHRLRIVTLIYQAAENRAGCAWGGWFVRIKKRAAPVRSKAGPCSNKADLSSRMSRLAEACNFGFELGGSERNCGRLVGRSNSLGVRDDGLIQGGRKKSHAIGAFAQAPQVSVGCKPTESAVDEGKRWVDGVSSICQVRWRSSISFRHGSGLQAIL